MKVLIVCSGNAPNFKFAIDQAFIYDQVNSISNHYPEIIFDYFFIKGNGVTGYLKNLKKLKRHIRSGKFDIIHAHYGLSGALSVLQHRVPVIITFHNGETRSFFPNLISSFASLIAAHSIYVAGHIYSKCYFKKKRKASIIPCGVSLSVINIQDKNLCQEEMQVDKKKINILFGSAFDNKIKNYALAKESCAMLNREDIHLIELKGYSREQVSKLINSCDLAILTSKSEGSPQFIKEAMACNLPVVATRVGDIEWLFGNTEGYFITSFDPHEIAEKIKLAIEFSRSKVRTHGRERIIAIGLDNENISKKIVGIYNKIAGK
jgi:teichuronic acid biosynthesis glycosyltransferase TuaC